MKEQNQEVRGENCKMKKRITVGRGRSGKQSCCFMRSPYLHCSENHHSIGSSLMACVSEG
jgi:hypothetical protein